MKTSQKVLLSLLISIKYLRAIFEISYVCKHIGNLLLHLPLITISRSSTFHFTFFFLAQHYTQRNMADTTISDVIASLHVRMSKFETELLKSSAPTTIEAIAADYAAFKTFTLAALKALQQQVELLARDVDQQEMRSRRKILLLHGVPEDSKEDTAQVVTKAVTTQLKIPGFTSAHINRCHRMGRAAGVDRPRPILVEVRDFTMRDQVWFAKTNLKGTSITLSEFLTKPRHVAFMAARERLGIKNCWTRDGFVHVIGPDGARHRICSIGELDKLMPPDTRRPAAAAPASRATTMPAKEPRAPSARRAGTSASAGRK